MAITVHRTAPSVPVKPFPKLMKHKGTDLIVFFKRPECGVVLRDGIGSFDQGRYCHAWRMDCFEDFIGTLEISNS